MASPQKENGYTAIANELFEALARIRISGEARQIIDVVFRKTYGFNKKVDAISLSQFSLATGLRKAHVCRAIEKAISMGIITKKGNAIANLFSINKDFSIWKSLPKKDTSTQKRERGVPKKDKNRTQKRDIQKTITKDSITKDNAPYGADVNNFIELFSLINPSYKTLYPKRPQRAAAEHLLEMHPFEWWKRFMAGYQTVLDDKFCPRAITPLELEAQLGKIEIYGRQRKAQQLKSSKKIII